MGTLYDCDVAWSVAELAAGLLPLSYRPETLFLRGEAPKSMESAPPLIELTRVLADVRMSKLL